MCVRLEQEIQKKTSMAGHNVLRMGTLATGQDDVGLPGEHVAHNDHKMTGGARRLAKNRRRRTSVEMLHVIRAANKAR